MLLINETLYGEPKGGKAKQWSVYVNQDKVIVEWGRAGGKLQQKTTICKAKNVGRSNETTPEEQAVAEALSKWTKQWDKYYRPTIEEAEAIEEEGVMLAEDYTKKPHLLGEEFYASPKLDGLRVKTVFNSPAHTDGLPTQQACEVPIWKSRGNKEYQVPAQLVEELKLLKEHTGLSVFDGEAYIHGVKLQKIQSCVKKHNELTPKVTYQIFDVPDITKGWEERLADLTSLKRVVDLLELEYVAVVEQTLTSKDNIKELLQGYLVRGFEGAMYRNKGGKYLFQNKRSNDLLKHKEFFDSEARVVSCSEDKNGQGLFTMNWVTPDTDNVVSFELSMNGPHVDNTYEKLSTRVGEWVHFKYQDLTEDGVPSFARGLYFRKCDSTGKPLE